MTKKLTLIIYFILSACSSAESENQRAIEGATVKSENNEIDDESTNSVESSPSVLAEVLTDADRSELGMVGPGSVWSGCKWVAGKAFLGPIGVAWEAGEVGALCIQVGGYAAIAHWDREQARKEWLKRYELTVKTCSEMAKVFEEMNEKYGCDLWYKSQGDLCGPMKVSLTIDDHCKEKFHPMSASQCSDSEFNSFYKDLEFLQNRVISCHVNARATKVLEKKKDGKMPECAKKCNY